MHRLILEWIYFSEALSGKKEHFCWSQSQSDAVNYVYLKYLKLKVTNFLFDLCVVFYPRLLYFKQFCVEAERVKDIKIPQSLCSMANGVAMMTVDYLTGVFSRILIVIWADWFLIVTFENNFFLFEILRHSYVLKLSFLNKKWRGIENLFRNKCSTLKGLVSIDI